MNPNTLLFERTCSPSVYVKLISMKSQNHFNSPNACKSSFVFNLFDAPDLNRMCHEFIEQMREAVVFITISALAHTHQLRSFLYSLSLSLSPTFSLKFSTRIQKKNMTTIDELDYGFFFAFVVSWLTFYKRDSIDSMFFLLQSLHFQYAFACNALGKWFDC